MVVLGSACFFEGVVVESIKQFVNLGEFQVSRIYRTVADPNVS